MNFNINDFTNFLFSSYPKPPCSYNLNIDSDNKFPVLFDILVNGAKKLYGDDIQPKNITEKQFDRLNEYIESIGYTIKYNYTFNENEITHINIWFVPYIIPALNNYCGINMKLHGRF